jgi:hypothetical protein
MPALVMSSLEPRRITAAENIESSFYQFCGRFRFKRRRPLSLWLLPQRSECPCLFH